MSDVSGKLASKTVKGSSAKQVRLRLVYIGVWSATKISFLVSLALAIINVVATFVIFTIIHAAGVFSTIDGLISDVAGTTSNIDVGASFSTLTITGFAMLGGIVLVVLGTIIGALGAVVYNAIAKLTGGLLVGFANPK